MNIKESYSMILHGKSGNSNDGVSMIIDFAHLNYDEYELFLPSPVFSKLTIDCTLMVGETFEASITIKCDNFDHFFTHVEVAGDFLLVEKDLWEGNELIIPYKISSKSYHQGRLLKGMLIFTYLGGETLIPISVEIVEKSAPQGMTQLSKQSPLSVGRKRLAGNYTLQTSKKSYNIDEEATLMVMNHQPYPLTITAETSDRQLEISQKSLVVQDIGVLKLAIKQSWWKRKILRKNYKHPVVTHKVHLSIQHDGGTDHVVMPIKFTTYSVASEATSISTEQSYKKLLIHAQYDYNRYIIKRDQDALHDAQKAIEIAMAYEGTDLQVWLFYLLVLTESGKHEEVKSHIQHLMQYSTYYLDAHKEEFVEIVTVLDWWLNGKDVLEEISTWPMTGYRQIFRLRVLTKGHLKFSVYESLYNSGYKSTHLFAHVASEIADRPYVPTKASPFYKSLVMWAISKGALSDAWLAYLEKMQFQVTNANLINSQTARQLYGMHPSEDTLRILVAISLSENKTDSSDNAIYLEALKLGVFFQELERRYVETAYYNALPIVFDFIDIYGLMRELDEKVITYLLRCYLEDEMTDKGAHVLAMRHYRDRLEQISQHSFNKDEAKLLAYDLEQKMQRHQWEKIGHDYSDLNLELLGQLDHTSLESLLTLGIKPLGYEWFHNKLAPIALYDILEESERSSYVDWLMATKGFEAISQIYEQGTLLKGPIEKNCAWTIELIDNDWPHGHLMCAELFEKGVREASFLKAYQKVFIGSVEEMIHFYEVLKNSGVFNESYMRKLLYKGILTRQQPEQILKVYRAYRKHFENEKVITYMNHYFSAVILIEEAYGYETLISIFENDLTTIMKTNNKSHPVALALLRLYQLYGHDNQVMCTNLIKNAVKNGIIFPWFASLAQPYIQKGAMRKGVFFAYHSKPWIHVKMHYRCDDQVSYATLPMKHVFFGFYIGYVMAFYKDYIQYFYEEEDIGHTKLITESGIHIHEVFTEPIGISNNFDVVNTIIMSEALDDEESVVTVIKEHIDHRNFIKNEMTLM